jgi:hypothetical protein
MTMSSRYDRIAPRTFITGDDLRAVQARGENRLEVRENSTVTDEARELAMKFGIRLDAPAVAGATGSPTSMRPTISTRPEDMGRKIADAIAEVLSELDLGVRAAALTPVVTRRVFAGLAKAAERK